MPTILIKKSDTPGSVPGTANLTNLAGGAEVAVNTADRRMFTMNSSSAVVEMGTNPSSLTCADGSFTLLKAASASITNLTATSLVLSNLSIASANVTTLTSASATITNLLATSLTVSGNTFLATSSGNVGIGTSSPAYKLDVAGNINAGVTVGVNNSSSGASAISRFIAIGDAGNAVFGMTSSAYTDITGAADSMLLNASSASGGISFALDGVLRMKLDSSGNLGLGVTPSAWYTLSTVFQSNGYAFEGRSGTPDYSAYWTNAYLNAAGSAFIYRSNGYATGYLQASGVHRWRTAASGTAGGTISFTETMTLDASGNLGVGTTSPTWILSLRRDSASGTAGLYPAVQVNNANASGYAAIYLNDSTAQAGLETRRDTAHLGLYAGAFERARITSDGNLLVGTTSISGTNSDNRIIGIYGAGTSNRAQLRFANTNSGVTGTDGTALSLDSSLNFYITQYENAAIVFETNGATERARITSGGALCVNATATTGYAEKLLTVQSGSGSAGSALTVQATAGDYAYHAQVNLIERSASSAFDFLRCFSGGTGGDIEFYLRGDGNAYADGTWNNNGADYAEFFESATGGALTVGATVVLDGNKVREATASDPVSSIMGVVRPKEPGKASMIVGNTAWNKWANKYLTDDFDRYIMEDHDVVEWTDEDGKEHSYESHRIPADVVIPADAVRKTHDDKGNKFQHYKLNPAWDKDAEYTPREKRDEWIIVGLVGQVKVLKGKPVNDRWIKMRDVSAAVEEWMIR